MANTSSLKRSKMEDEVSETQTTLTTCPEDHIAWTHQSRFNEDDQAIIDRSSLMHNIKDDIFFTERFPIRLELKQLNVVKLEEIDAVLVSNF